MATLAIIALSVGGGLQAYSQIQAGRAARAQGEAAAAIAERNALLAERQAEEEKVAAAAAAKVQTREGEELLARQRALFAKTGVEISAGTPLAVVVDTALTVEADRLTILREGAVRAGQRTGQAGVFRATGAAAKAKGRAAARGAKLAAAGTILSTVGTVGAIRGTTRIPGTRTNTFPGVRTPTVRGGAFA